MSEKDDQKANDFLGMSQEEQQEIYGVQQVHVCPECWGTKKHVVQTVELKGEWVEIKEACPHCQGQGKTPVDKIREAFEGIYEESKNLVIGPMPDIEDMWMAFQAGNRLAQAEIERLKDECIKAKDYMVELSKTVVEDGMIIVKLRKERDLYKDENEALKSVMPHVHMDGQWNAGCKHPSWSEAIGAIKARGINIWQPKENN